MMTHRVKEIHRELTKLKRLGAKGRKKFFKSCSKECVFSGCECIGNLLNANLKIKPSHLKKLSRHKKTLRTLAAKSTSLVKRKRLLQGGGFLSTLLPIIIPAVANLLGGFAGRANG